MKPLFALVLAIHVTTSAADNVSLIHASDPQMNAAIVRARQTLPEFLAIKSKPEGAQEFTLKVLLAKEHVWVTPFRSDGKGGYQGLLKSEPRSLTHLRWGQEVSFGSEQITDWGYTKDGKRIGFFTTCVLLSRDLTLKKRLQSEGRHYVCAP